MADLPRVLVVDDSRLVRASLVQHIRASYDVREEGDGEAAWQALVLDQSIRAVVSDLQMPKMNGYQLLERLRTSRLHRLQQMPFILVSGEETEEERARARSAGASDFITKGSGTVDGLKFGRILRPGLPVAVRGAGMQHSGNYYVTRVSHRIERGGWEQRFEAWRNGVGLTGVESFVDPLAALH